MLKENLERYIALKISLGFRFADQSRLLSRFVLFAEKNGDEFIRADRVMQWLICAPSRMRKHDWLVTIRHFALWLRAEDHRHEVPPKDAVGRVVHIRPSPHILSPDDISRIIQAAGELKPEGSFRSIMYPVLFGLMAATGMRVSEALGLTVDDITEDGLIIRQTKFRKSRMIPLHDTTRQALEGYLIKRNRRGGPSNSVFVVNTGKAPDRSTVSRVFLGIVRSLGLKDGPGHRGPRLHDLRHSFAVRCLEQCGGDRDAVKRQIVALSTYLGHACVTDTYWYLEATPILLKQIAQDGEHKYKCGGAGA
jgi:integrase